MPAGALVAFLEPGPNAPVELFREIFATEHLPPVTKLPEFTRGAAYRTADGSVPSWGAFIELSDIGVLQTDAVRFEQSAREKAMLADLAAIDRRVLLLLSDSSSSPDNSEAGAGADVEAGNAIALVSLNPDVGAWVLDGHNLLIEAVPGWLRTRTYQLVSAISKGPTVEGKPTPQLLAFHEFAGADALASKEFLDAAPSDHEELQIRTAVLYQIL